MSTFKSRLKTRPIGLTKGMVIVRPDGSRLLIQADGIFFISSGSIIQF